MKSEYSFLGLAVHMGEMRNTYKILVGKLEKHSEELGVNGN
jgi:hypothetical protein